MLERERTAVVVIDMQASLYNVMHEREQLLASVLRLVQAASVLQVPVLATEQNPDRLGTTMPEVAACMPAVAPIAKVTFSCARTATFMQRLRQSGRSQLLLCGMESHICVYQAAIELLERGFAVEVVADGVSSRTALNRQVGLDRCQAAGAAITSVETALFELLGSATDADFKAIAKIIK